jgi:hypothetical protein
MYCKPKIRNLEHPLLDEHIGGLDIPVHDVATGEVLESLEELTHQGPYFFLGQRTTFLEGFLQAATLTELGDEVTVVGAFEDLHTTDDMRMVQ